MPCLLSVVVVTWNTRDLLRECLGALSGEPNADWMRIVCVDNGSSDGSAELVAREFPTVVLVRSDENLGFARGANMGIAVALERYAPRFIALVNSDLIVTPAALAVLVKHLDSHPEVAAVSPRLRHPGGRLQSGAAGFAPSAWSGLAYFLFLSALTRGWCRGVFIDQRHYAKRRGPVAVDLVTGACPVIRSDAIRSVGFLDGQFFMYAEDAEWCCRARRAGYAIHYLPAVEAVHRQGGSTATPNPSWLASLCEMVRRDRGGIEYLVFRLAAALGLGARAALYGLAYAVSRRVRYRQQAQAMGVYARWAFNLRETSAQAPGEMRRDRPD